MLETSNSPDRLSSVTRQASGPVPVAAEAAVEQGSVAPSVALKAENVDRSIENLTNDELKSRLLELANSIDRDLQFRIDDATGRTVVTVLDGETNEVIRQIPSEEALRLVDRLHSRVAVLFESEA